MWIFIDSITVLVNSERVHFYLKYFEFMTIICWKYWNVLDWIAVPMCSICVQFGGYRIHRAISSQVCHAAIREFQGVFVEYGSEGVVCLCFYTGEHVLVPRRVPLARANDSLGLSISRPRPSLCSWPNISLCVGNVPGHSLCQGSRVCAASWHCGQVGETSLLKCADMH